MQPNRTDERCRDAAIERKIIQIATTSPFFNDEAACPAGLYALCDDGSVWSRYGLAEWRRVPALPEGEGVLQPTLLNEP